MKTEIELPSEDEASEYLDARYPEEGHRQQLYAAAYDIAHRIVNYIPTDAMDGVIMRMAWECSKAGHSNIAVAALGDAHCGGDIAYWEHVAIMMGMDGFLTAKEKWHTARMTDVTVYRGCSQAEIDAARDEGDCLGYSWTLDKEVSKWFAQQHAGKILSATVVSVKASDLAWLDTPESEVILIMPWSDAIRIEDAPTERIDIDWDTRTPITPTKARKAA